MTDLIQRLGLPPVLKTTEQQLAQLHIQSCPRGTTLFHPGETVKGFVLVLSGRVDVFLTGPTGRDILLYSVETGQSCVQSTLGLMGGEDYSAEAVTQTACDLILVPRETFLGLIHADPGFRSFVFEAFAKRMQSMMHLVERVAFLRVEARLAAALLDLEQDGVVTATQADLATRIGSAREVVSRRLDTLATRGLLTLERGRVVLHDAETLREIARAGM